MRLTRMSHKLLHRASSEEQSTITLGGLRASIRRSMSQECDLILTESEASPIQEHVSSSSSIAAYSGTVSIPLGTSSHPLELDRLSKGALQSLAAIGAQKLALGQLTNGA